MNDSNDKLEIELAALRPRQLSADLAQRIEAATRTTSRPWSDRILFFAMGMGSLAACVIVGILTFSGSVSTDPHPTHPLQPIATAPMLGSYSLILAHNDDAGMNPAP
jgi:hypothetical protein